MEIRDTSGQEKYNALENMVYIGAHAILILYSITNRPSFERAKKIFLESKNAKDSVKIVYCLIGTHSDHEELRTVTFKEG